MAKSNRECYSCSKKYYYCPQCSNEIKKEAFYNMFCCERCSKIFKLLTDESLKKISTLDSKSELIKLNVTLDEEFKGSVKKHIEKVLSFIDETEIKKDELVESEVVENTPIEITPVKIKTTSRKRVVKNSEVD